MELRIEFGRRRSPPGPGQGHARSNRDYVTATWNQMPWKTVHEHKAAVLECVHGWMSHDVSTRWSMVASSKTILPR